ncbi:uncharacterized protein LOC130704242 isoform X3 [Daphnia carinata]|uniref:uncharacterized protein LOC130704242 isoform X3 n=1 Tax=Daphnia carinata TaxID=120202 RepID=UPI0028685E99|nr:uncharacterized protein LOC130704242 isoform X3 [Daphnia carinata]
MALITAHSDAKGFGYKRMKSPGRNMKMPKSKMGLGTGMGIGMGAGMGMGLGMGMGAALLIPVVIPMRHGYRRHRNSYRHGTQCYACEGMDNDVCVISPATISRRVSCPHNQYCSVLRREISFQPSNPIGSHKHTVSHGNTSTLSSNTIQTTAMDDPGEAGQWSLKSTESNTRVLISRGCKPPDVLQSNLMTSTGPNGDTTKTYIQFCLTELCNVGDGRLKCYECEGEGSNHMCMVNPSEVAKVVTCESNEYCNILRMTAINVTASAKGPVESTTVFISRGCKAAGVTDDDHDPEEGTSILSLSCSSDLCNYVDGADLDVINSANGLNLERFSLLIIASLLILLLWQ